MPAYVNWYPSDFLQGIADLDYPAIAVYTVVLNLIYDFDGPIADDPGRIARRCGMRRPMCEAVLDRLIGLGKLARYGGQIHNTRAAKEVEKRKERVTKAKASAQARWSEDDKNINKNSGEKMPPHTPSTSPPDAIQNQNQGRKKEDGAEAPLPMDFPNEKPDARVYRRARQIFGKADGGLIAKRLLTVKGNIPEAMAALEAAAGTDTPKDYVWAIIRPKKRTMVDGGDQWRDNIRG